MTEDIGEMVAALEETYQIYQPAFERSDQAAHGWDYLEGLLSDIHRKLTDRIAPRFGKNIRSLQLCGKSLSRAGTDGC